MRFLIFLLLISSYTFAQQSYVTTAGDTIHIGDKLQIGPGSNPDGTYKFFDGFFTPGVSFAGAIVTVRSIGKSGSKKSGYVYFLRVHPGVGMVTYNIYVDNALRVGEVLLKPELPKGKIIN